MKTISIAEFEKLVVRDDWQREQDYEVLERFDNCYEKYDDKTGSLLGFIDVHHVRGWATKTSTIDGIKITYTEGFDYDEGDPASLEMGTEGYDDVWVIEGAVVVDECGDELTQYELNDYLNSDFRSIDYSGLEIEKVTDMVEVEQIEKENLENANTNSNVEHDNKKKQTNAQSSSKTEKKNTAHR